MNAQNYVTNEELAELMRAPDVPAAQALLNAAAKRRAELIEQAVNDAGNKPDAQVTGLLMQVKTLDWITTLPAKVTRLVNQDE